MKKEDAEEFTQSLGQIVAGSWRQVALAKRLGVPKALGLTVEDWVREKLGGYIRLAIPDRREAVVELSAEGLSQREIGQVLGVGTMTVNRDLEAVPNGTPVETGSAEINHLTTQTVPNGTPLDAVAALAADEEIQTAIEREKKRREREEKRELKRSEAATIPMPNGTFRLIYADPPWRYEHVKTESRAIENQYPTMSLEEIKDVPIPAAEDCALFLWTTSPKLAESMDVIRAWGFEYRTCAVWDKEMIGMGYYFRQQHELLLVATKGNPGVPDEADRVASIFRSSAFRARRGNHSEKPKEIYELIERMYPGGSRIELFARSRRQGWECWGNEADAA